MASGAEGPHQLDLKTGAIEPVRRQGAVHAFRKWTVGIKTTDGDFVPLLDVGPRYRDDDSSTEPHEV